MRAIIVWFRQDLRLADHGALAAAVGTGARVVPVYVHAPEESAPWAAGAASRWWLHHSLAALGRSLAEEGSQLTLRRGPSGAALAALALETGAQAIYWNRTYEPRLAARDARVRAELTAAGLDAESFAGNVLIEPGTLLNRAGEPFRVFTPFWRAAEPRLDEIAPAAAAPALPPLGDLAPATQSLDSLGLLPEVRWDLGFAARFAPGEHAAQRRLADFLDGAAESYPEGRDRPAEPGTSRLSPHLHFGELSPRQVLAAVRGSDLAPGPATRRRGLAAFLRELGWREFAHHVLHHFPHTSEAPLDPRFARHDWRKDPAALAAWQRGATGIPLVDAGMRELWHSGWMHNRVRMVVASLLTKNLGIDWLEGARWFHDTLLDADLASNTLGWQWTAGCGADAAPYYRIFNPVLQAERFDPKRAYLRTWLPELRLLPDEWLHRPWLAPPSVLEAAGVHLGTTYPAPIVDLRLSRERALAAYARARSASPAPRASG